MINTEEKNKAGERDLWGGCNFTVIYLCVNVYIYVYIYKFSYTCPFPSGTISLLSVPLGPSMSSQIARVHSFFSFLLNHIPLYVYYVFITHSLVDRYLGCSQALAVPRNVAMTTGYRYLSELAFLFSSDT